MSGKKVLIDGHRGNPDFVPENTMDSFRSAVELGVDAVETDIHLSSDNALVLTIRWIAPPTARGWCGKRPLRSWRR